MATDKKPKLEVSDPIPSQQGVVNYEVQDGTLSRLNQPVSVTFFTEHKKGFCSDCEVGDGRAAWGCKHVRAVKAAFRAAAPIDKNTAL